MDQEMTRLVADIPQSVVGVNALTLWLDDRKDRCFVRTSATYIQMFSAMLVEEESDADPGSTVVHP